MKKEFPPQGAEFSPSGVHYRVWAPRARDLSVQIVSKNQARLREISLVPAGDGYFHGLDELGAAGDRYLFRLDQKKPLPDPASRFQPEGVHGPSMVVDPLDFEWTDLHWKRPEFRDLVIYELHVGTFTREGTFLAAVEKLKHIREVGANAVELMPIGEFPGGRNWGYDGVYLFAPSRAYGSPDDLRSLVNAAHCAGIAVILDVVYNHFGPDGNYLHEYVGQYLDEAKKTPWGGAIRYGNPEFKPLRDLVASNPGYWMSEFHIDGFRLDATHAIIDESPRHLLQELTASIHRRGGLVIAEDPRNDPRLVTPEEKGGFGFDGVWADDFHHIVRVGNTREKEGYLGDFDGTMGELVETLENGWLYRGQLSASSGKARGGECAHLPPECFVHCISNHDQTGNHAFGERLSHRIHPAALRAAEALLCLTPFTPMIFMGQEWGASTPFLFFTEHNPELGKLIVEGRREEFKNFPAFNAPEMLEKIPNPQAVETFEASKLVWPEASRGRHAAALELYRACLGLRASEAAFRPITRDSWSVKLLSFGAGALEFRSQNQRWIVLFDLYGGHAGSLKDDPAFATIQQCEIVLSSNDSLFGGDGICAVDIKTLRADFLAPQTVVLRAPFPPK